MDPLWGTGRMRSKGWNDLVKLMAVKEMKKPAAAASARVHKWSKGGRTEDALALGQVVTTLTCNEGLRKYLDDFLKEYPPQPVERSTRRAM